MREKGPEKKTEPAETCDQYEPPRFYVPRNVRYSLWSNGDKGWSFNRQAQVSAEWYHGWREPLEPAERVRQFLRPWVEWVVAKEKL